MQHELRNEYFEWLCNIVCGMRLAPSISYRKLLVHLHAIPFQCLISKDQNRAEDGKSLRYRFSLVTRYSDDVDEILDILDGPCSVLEMIVALAVRCEEDIMDDPAYGNRTGQWFWGMIVNLGLGSMTDDKYDEFYVDEVIDIFLSRTYLPNGEGGLFTVKYCEEDLRDIEIWTQMCWYLNDIT